MMLMQNVSRVLFYFAEKGAEEMFAKTHEITSSVVECIKVTTVRKYFHVSYKQILNGKYNTDLKNFTTTF